MDCSWPPSDEELKELEPFMSNALFWPVWIDFNIPHRPVCCTGCLRSIWFSRTGEGTELPEPYTEEQLVVFTARHIRGWHRNVT